MTSFASRAKRPTEEGPGMRAVVRAVIRTVIYAAHYRV
jgi:hypothetical protein